MSDRKTTIYAWYISLLCLVIALVFISIFILSNWRFTFGIIAVVFIVLFAILFSSSQKKIRIKNEYTVIQAINFYSTCLRAGYDGKKNADSSILLKSAEVEGLDSLSTTQLMQCYRDGQDTVKIMNNKILRMIWRIPKH